MDPLEFADRAFSHLPSGPVHDYHFASWKHGGRPTSEGVGLLPVSGVDPQKLIDAIFDVDHYVGNVAHVTECRSIPDDKYQPPKALRFYELINVPMVAKIQMELVIEDRGERDGYRYITWHQLDAETQALNTKKAARSDYNAGMWFVRDGFVGYALASAPRKEDVGRLKFMALTKGADATAPKIFKANIEGLVAWTKRR